MGWLRGLLFTSAFPGNPREVRPVPASVSCLWFRLAFPSNPRGVRSVPGQFHYSLILSCISFIVLFNS